MQDAPKAVWSIPYVSLAFFPSLKQNFIAYRSSKVSSRPDCIFEIHQLWQSGLSRMYSNSCCSCSFETEIIKIGQSFHKMYSNKILNCQESTTILNACTKRSGNLLKAPLTFSSWEIVFAHSSNFSHPKHLAFNDTEQRWVRNEFDSCWYLSYGIPCLTDISHDQINPGISSNFP